jgi:DUF1365 family protein
MESCIYEGRVRHTRQAPAEHSFDYRLFLMYLDLDELPSLFERRWLWSTTRSAIARFRRSDHMGPEDEALDESVRKLVHAETGRRPDGPIRLLTNLAYFGYCFNPVSFYYCFDKAGEQVEFIVAEVNNTPWGETDTYVLPCEPEKRGWRFTPSKKMHVSPFMPMDIDYRWALSSPAGRLSVYMANLRDGQKFFDATMALERRPITGSSLAAVLFRFPFMTLKVILAIHWEALRLWVKGCPFYEHPAKRKEVTAQ